MSSPEGQPARLIKYAHAAPEGDELEQWKTSVLAMIDKRTDRYPMPPRKSLPTMISHAALLLLTRMKQLWRNLLRILHSRGRSISPDVALKNDPQSIFLDTNRIATATERVGYIPELVENILRFVDAETQIRVAWQVSSLWKHTVAHVITTSDLFRQTQPCKAVERDSPRDLDAFTDLLEPSDEDIQKFEDELLLLRGLLDSSGDSQTRKWPEICPTYWPAHVRASNALPHRIIDLYDEVRGRSSSSPFWATTVHAWQDSTQLKMNPYFQTVLSQELSESVGAYELELQSLHESDNLVFGNNIT